CGIVSCDATIDVVGIDAVGPAVTNFLFDCAAGEVDPLLVEIAARLVDAGYPYHHRRCIGHCPESLFALAKRIGGFSAICDIVHDRQDAILAADERPAQADFHPEKLARFVSGSPLKNLWLAIGRLLKPGICLFRGVGRLSGTQSPDAERARLL